MKVGVAVLVACMMVAGPVEAATKTQKRNAMHHIAQVLAVQRLCDRVEANQFIISALLTMYGIDLSGPDGEVVVEDSRSQIASLGEQDEDAVCAAGLLLYGPKGQNVPDLVRKK